MTKILKLITFLCLSTGLFAEPEYEIVLLAPEGQELVEAYYTSKCLNEAGYVWMSSYDNTRPFVYHKDLGFKVIPVPLDQYHESKVLDVNCHGVAVGVLSKYPNYYWETTCDRIFVYDTKNGDYYDLLDHFNSNGMEDYSIENDQIYHLTISDNNQIIFKRGRDLRTYIYDLNTKTISIFTHGDLSAVNKKGQMVGTESSQSWFFDLNRFHLLGSLDKFNRWPVEPKALSQDGFVVGEGINSYGEDKIFIWHPNLGLKEMDFPHNYFRIKAINNSGQVIGSFEIISKRSYYDHAFITCPELGFKDLGVLKGGRESSAKAINNHGQVVGESRDREDNSKAFVWDLEHGMRDLNTLISQDNSGWKKLSKAKAINDSGYIVGRGNYYGVEQYFLLIPKSKG